MVLSLMRESGVIYCLITAENALIHNAHIEIDVVLPLFV